jgi:hypothetical protein
VRTFEVQRREEYFAPAAAIGEQGVVSLIGHSALHHV